MGTELVPYDPGPIDRELRRRRQHWTSFAEHATPQQAKRQKSAILQELDGLWQKKGWMNALCLVSGYGSWTEWVSYEEKRDDDIVINDFVLVEHAIVGRKGWVTAVNGHSRGFDLTDFDFNEANYRLSYMFELSTAFDGVRPQLWSRYIPCLQIAMGTLEFVPVSRMAPLRPLDAPNAAKLN